MLKKLINKIHHWLVPYTCVLCGSSENNTQDLCLSCKEELPWIEHTCIRCSHPLEKLSLEQSNNQTCGECLKKPPCYDKAFALFRYQKPIDKLIINLKFHQKLLYAKLLGELMAESLTTFYKNDHLPEIIIPVPLHPQRLKERGYNQALELAKPIAKKFSIPIDNKLCRRIRSTQPQSLIPATERKRNIKNAFAITPTSSIKHLAIIDDVITTGNTIQELSLTLRNATNSQRIDIWSCAKVLSL
jgi:ComF family protein